LVSPILFRWMYARFALASPALVRFCEGFRMPAQVDGATPSVAGVRKPPTEETAGGVAKQRVSRYGDFGAGGQLPRCVDGLPTKSNPASFQSEFLANDPSAVLPVYSE